jgi:hypothetical protein
MAGNDLAVLTDQHRIGEAELPDAVGDLSDLLLGVGPGIAGMRPQARDRHRLDGYMLDATRYRGLGGDGRQSRPARRDRCA